MKLTRREGLLGLLLAPLAKALEAAAPAAQRPTACSLGLLDWPNEDGQDLDFRIEGDACDQILVGQEVSLENGKVVPWKPGMTVFGVAAFGPGGEK